MVDWFAIVGSTGTVTVQNVLSFLGPVRSSVSCLSSTLFTPDPQIPDSRPVPPRFGRENSRDFPDPDWPGIGKILGILPRARFGRDPGKSGNPDLAGIGEIAGIYAPINRDQDRDLGSGFHFLVVHFGTGRPKMLGSPFGTTSGLNLNSLFIMK